VPLQLKQHWLKGGFEQLLFQTIVLLTGFGFYMADWNSANRLVADYSTQGDKGLADYGIALLMVMFAYSGWNAASYLAGEIKDPEKNLPRAMFLGTCLITIIYLLLNFVFLLSTPGSELIGQRAVGAIASENLFGAGFSNLFTLGICCILLSAISVQMMIGPRVYYAMARDKMIFKSLARINPKLKTPSLAIVIQVYIAIIYVFLGEGNTTKLLVYMGFSLSIFPLLSVVGLIILRYQRPDIPRPYKVPFFPLIPAVYVILTLAMMTASLIKWTETSLFAISINLLGIFFYMVWHRKYRQDCNPLND